MHTESRDVCLLITPLHRDTAGGLDGSFRWVPQLIGATDSEIVARLEAERPRVLAVGANRITGEVIRAWRRLLPDRELAIVRRGTSLAAIDTEAAAACGVEVYNLPGINSPYVAEFMSARLLVEGTSGALAVIGVGDIGQAVARSALAAGWRTRLYSRRLADPAPRAARLAELGLDEREVHCSATLSAALDGADRVAICLPLVHAGAGATRHVITAAHIELLAPGARVVSVSEPEVFAPAALRALHARKDLHVVIDNARPLLEAVLRELGVDQPREGFVLTSSAMSADGCQRDLDQALLMRIAACTLSRRAREARVASEASKAAIHPRGTAVEVVGGGLSGLMLALTLQERGWGPVEVVDVDEGLAQRGGATYAQRCRHLSVTETLPHCSPGRSEVLSLPPERGGWALRKADSSSERAWVAQFSCMTRKPALHALSCSVIAAFNLAALEAWHDRFAQSPALLEGAWFARGVLRAYLSEASLEGGWALQSRVDPNAKRLPPALLAERHPVLGPAITSGLIAGGIEGTGYGLDIIQLAANLHHLLTARGVTFRRGIGPSGARLAVVSPGARWEGVPGECARHVQGVVGCWLTLPNPGLLGAVKIHAPEPVGVMNLAPSLDGRAMYVSGGFGFLGEAPADLDAPGSKALLAQLESILRRVFPKEWAQARDDGTLAPRLCVRPMTPDGLPLLHLERGAPPVLYVGGTSSGGATQAPLLATLAADMLDGRPHPLTAVFSSARSSLRPGE